MNMETSSIERLISRKIAPLKKEIKRLRADLDAIEDTDAIHILNNAPDEERFPADVARRLVAGEHPIKIFREHRALTQKELADAANTSTAYISQIESRHRQASRDMVRRIAEALNVDTDDL